MKKIRDLIEKLKEAGVDISPIKAAGKLARHRFFKSVHYAAIFDYGYYEHYGKVATKALKELDEFHSIYKECYKTVISIRNTIYLRQGSDQNNEAQGYDTYDMECYKWLQAVEGSALSMMETLYQNTYSGSLVKKKIEMIEKDLHNKIDSACRVQANKTATEYQNTAERDEAIKLARENDIETDMITSKEQSEKWIKEMNERRLKRYEASLISM